jgi:hypothetical protein
MAGGGALVFVVCMQMGTDNMWIKGSEEDEYNNVCV